MAMLAGPRQKRKWIINPGAGQDWVNDDNKFGQKLMEKMGWSKGKGLGREEQGNPDHIRISLKENKKGVGYKGYDDEWIKHYEGFEDVLSKLNNIEETQGNSKDSSRAASSDEENQSIQSLERRSKCSRARVHYHKFARGKDLSRYSKDDIACITGSKRAKQIAEEEIEADEPNEPDATPVKTINSGSIQDYFSQKMAQLKGKLPLGLTQPKEYESDEEVRVGFGMQHQNNKETEDSYKEDICDENKTMEAEEDGRNISQEGETDERETKKSKKKKRAERDAEAKIEEQEIISHEVNMDEGVSTSKKKKKKKKREYEEEFLEENENKEEQITVADEISSHEVRLEYDELPKKKKKSKRKEKIIEEETVKLDDMGEDEQHVEVKVTKKKKKQRKMQEPIAGEEAVTSVEAEENQEVPAREKKKNKKRKEREGETVNVDENNVEEALNDDEYTEKQKKKWKKSKKKHQAEETTNSDMKQEQAISEEDQGNDKEAQVEENQNNGEKETEGMKHNEKSDEAIVGRNDTQSSHNEGTEQAVRQRKQGMRNRYQTHRKPFSWNGRFKPPFQNRNHNGNFFNSNRAFNRQPNNKYKVKPVFTTQGCEQGFQHFRGAQSYEGYTM